MTERPILFSGPMVRAILERRKTQTRRLVKPQPIGMRFNLRTRTDLESRCVEFVDDDANYSVRCPYGQPGDELWVREAWCAERDSATSKATGRFLYRADGEEVFEDDGDGYAVTNKDGSWKSPWKSSIHMPRRASRLTLRVTGVRVERLHEISEDDARAEGAMFHDGHGIGHSGWRHDYRGVFATARESFASGWDSINGKRAPWSSNPWVWVVEFAQEPAP